MDDFLVSGIQQVGIGVPDLGAELAWCIRAFGTNIQIFEDDGEARLMLPYTGGVPQARWAKLVANLAGGAGIEIWQYRGRTPRPPGFAVMPGDLGITMVRIKARDPSAARAAMEKSGVGSLGPLCQDPEGKPCFIVHDPLGLPFQVVLGQEWFRSGASATGGVSGCMIGVSDMERAAAFYQSLLGYDRVIYDRSGAFADLGALPGGNCGYRRVLVGRSAPPSGAFGPLLGTSRLELVQCLDRQPRKVFADRFWGDLGFIHLCFDVRGMDALKERCRQAGSPFTVDSGSSFQMGEAAGRFAYVEDPDGTLIEFVETYRLSIARSLGLALDLRRRPYRKPLPRLLLAGLALNRIRNP